MAIDAFARSAGFEIVDTYYDEAVSGADPVALRVLADSRRIIVDAGVDSAALARVLDVLERR